MVGGQDTGDTEGTQDADESATAHEDSREIAEVHLEACVAFVGEGGASDGVCLVCGYLGDEHDDLFEFLGRGEVVAA